MKQKDLALIAVIVFISAIVSFLLSNKVFATPQNRAQQVEVVETISASFSEPDKRYFNGQAFDPTRIITIGQDANPQPFKGTR